MIDKKKIKELIQKRIENEGFIEAGDERAWENLSNYLSSDIAASIEYLETEATPNEIYWISEVFEDIAAKTRSKEFVAALRRIYDKLPKEIKRAIEFDIESSERTIR